MPSRDLVALRGLLERVKAAEGPDRGLDAGLMLGLGLLTRRNRLAEFPEEDPIWEYHNPERNSSGLASVMVPLLTGSVDAVLALVERVLPGWGGRVSFPAPGCTARLWHLQDAGKTEPADGATPALALLAALLSALIAQEERADGR